MTTHHTGLACTPCLPLPGLACATPLGQCLLLGVGLGDDTPSTSDKDLQCYFSTLLLMLVLITLIKLGTDCCLQKF